MKKERHFTALLSNLNLDKFYINKEYYNLLYVRKCDYDDKYSFIEYEVISEDINDADIEIMINTLGALMIHEEGTNGFCFLLDDEKELGNIYTWESSGEVAISDLLTRKERIYLLRKESLKEENTLEIFFKTCNPEEQKMDKWRKLDDDKGEIFSEDISELRFGYLGKPEKVWLPNLVEESEHFYFVALDYDSYEYENLEELNDDLVNKMYNYYYQKDEYDNDYDISPWFNDRYYDYEYGYDNKYYNK